MRRLIGSGTTDANGYVSVDYTGKGLGKLQIIAECNGIVSEVYTLYDALFKDTKGEKTWTASGYMDKDVSSDEYVQLSSNASNQSYIYQTITDDYNVFEFDLFLTCPSDETVSTVIRFNNGSSNNGTFYQSNIHLETDRWYHIKIVADNENMKYHMYLDNSNEVHYSINKVSSHNRFYFLINANLHTVIKYKNLIMYR